MLFVVLVVEDMLTLTDYLQNSHMSRETKRDLSVTETRLLE